VWISKRNGLYGIYMKAANGAGADELLYESADNKVTMGWTPDGSFLLFRNLSPETGTDIWILPLEGDRKPWPWLATEFFESSNSAFSPDGKWIAYSSDESGRGEVYIQAFAPPAPASGAKFRISTDGGGLPRWRRDGRGLYYFNNTGKLMEADLTLGEGIKAGTPRELFDTRAIKAEMSRGWTMTSDEQRFLFVTHGDESTQPLFTILVNWTTEMKK
jgi:eukaryotic-like serine/threonine-protein kinase